MVKKWSEEEISKRIDNLKKIVSNRDLENALLIGFSKTDNKVDALHEAFYYLKSYYLRYNEFAFGIRNTITEYGFTQASGIYNNVNWYYNTLDSYTTKIITYPNSFSTSDNWMWKTSAVNE